MDKHPIDEQLAKLKRGSLISKCSMVLMILSLFPFAFGLAKENLWLSVPGGVLVVATLGSLLIGTYQMKSASDEMLGKTQWNCRR